MGICCCSPLAQPGSFQLPDNILRVDHKTKATAIGVISRSFAGTATTDPEGTTDWVLGPLLKEKWDDPRRMKMMTWFIGFLHTMVVEQLGGFVLAAKKEDGTLGAAIMINPYTKGISGDCMVGCRALLPAGRVHGMPPFKEMGDANKGMQKRLYCLDKVDEVHKKHLSGPHVYVNCMAVDPTCQGMGFCGRLMRFMNAYADERKLPLYLETSGLKNVAIYERFGYKSVEQFQISCPKDPDQSKPHTDDFAMIRPAAA